MKQQPNRNQSSRVLGNRIAISDRSKPDPTGKKSYGYYYGPFTPLFFYEGGSYYVKIHQSYVGNDQAELGTNEWKIPQFQSSDIINPDLTDPTWEAPKLIQTAGDWEMFLVVGVASTSNSSADIIVQTAATADPTAKPPWKNVYKLATWTIETYGSTVRASNVRMFAAKGLESSVHHYEPFYPIIWHDGTNFKAKFTPAHVQPYNGAIIDVTVNGGAMATDAGQTITTADTWYLKITTDANGVPTAADLAKQTSPSNTKPDGAATTGIFYYKVCTFSLDGDFMIPELHWSGNVLWQWEYQAAAESTHPWKVTDSSTSGKVDIEAGLIMANYIAPNTSEFTGWGTPYATAGYHEPFRLTLGPVAAYAGSSGTVSVSDTGTYYIYASITSNTGTVNEIAEAGVDAPSSVDGDGQYVSVELADYMQPASWTTANPPATVTISVTSYDPSDTTDASTQQNQGRICIAKSVNGEITQYVTHNPTLMTPIINVQSDVSA